MKFNTDAKKTLDTLRKRISLLKSLMCAWRAEPGKECGCPTVLQKYRRPLCSFFFIVKMRVNWTF